MRGKRPNYWKAQYEYNTLGEDYIVIKITSGPESGRLVVLPITDELKEAVK